MTASTTKDFVWRIDKDQFIAGILFENSSQINLSSTKASSFPVDVKVLRLESESNHEVTSFQVPPNMAAGTILPKGEYIFEIRPAIPLQRDSVEWAEGTVVVVLAEQTSSVDKQ